MSRTREPLGTPFKAARIRERLLTEPPGPVRQRLRAVQLGLETDLSLEEIAAKIGCARSTVQEWFARFRESGMRTLFRAPRGQGPKSRLTPRAEAFLRAGLKEKRWRTAREIHRALVRRGIDIRPPTVYYYLRKLQGLPAKTPKPKPRAARKADRGRQRAKTSARR